MVMNPIVEHILKVHPNATDGNPSLNQYTAVAALGRIAMDAITSGRHARPNSTPQQSTEDPSSIQKPEAHLDIESHQHDSIQESLQEIQTHQASMKPSVSNLISHSVSES